ncbi:MAG TPA: hypothetical protein PLX23_04190 [Candidatus Hydrogenedens sp.]|nr:hypothetical protein [Candidatus Hydrogenedens sp.]
MKKDLLLISLCLLFNFQIFANSEIPESFWELKDFVVYIADGTENDILSTVAQVLIEELANRTGVQLKYATKFAKDKNCIILTTKNYLSKKPSLFNKCSEIGLFSEEIGTHLAAEGFGILSSQQSSKSERLWIIGNDNRGVLFGVGKLLRMLNYSQDSIKLIQPIKIIENPISSIRGHQLGYRARANSYDAWNVAQFDQFIRELTFWGVNSIENIPFQDEQESPLMPVPRREMNRAMSEICKKYGLDYWIWVPADFNLNDKAKRADMLKRHEELYQDCPVLTGIFFPGGDPGDNPPELVIPFLEDLSKLAIRYHPEARIWLSLQNFSLEQSRYVFNYLNKEQPKWFGGLCEGPSSPPIPYLRQNLPHPYRLRMYPDITHNKPCQYPVPWWDTAFAMTIGREGINPRPVQFAYIHNWFQPYCDGFISYSDGVHDDVNKVIWSAMAWNPQQKIRDVLTEYANVFFGSNISVQSADGILALENNWRGSAIDNGAIEGTLKLWQNLEQTAPQLKNNWRWQMCLVRAYYDAYVREKLIYEQQLEEQANQILQSADAIGSEQAIQKASEILNKAVSEPVPADLRERIINLYDDLFRSIGLQSSVEKYSASGGKRGASLDYIDIPLNNRWWLEDQFQAIQQLSSEKEKTKRLNAIALWENPGIGSFYDDVGNTAKSPHVKRCEVHYTNPTKEAWPESNFWWFDEGKSRKRISWLSSLERGEALYQGLHTNSKYLLRISGVGKPTITIDGKEAISLDKKEMKLGEFKEYIVPEDSVQDREITVKWCFPPEDIHKDWEYQSQICEMWLLKQ